MVVGHITLTFTDDVSEMDAKDITENFAAHIHSHPWIDVVRAETGRFERAEPQIPGRVTIDEAIDAVVASRQGVEDGTSSHEVLANS